MLRRRLDLGLFLGALALRLLHLFLYKDDFWLRTPLLDDNLFLSFSEVISREGWKAPSLGTFYLNPAYPYFLAGLRAVAGAGPTVVFCVQHVLGALTPVLLFHLADRLFERKAALIAGVLAAVYGPALFFESRYLGEHFIYLFNAGFLLALLLARQSARPPAWWALAGLCLGLSSVFRPTGLILLPIAGLWGLATVRPWQRLGACFALFALSLWLPLLPFQLRNRAVDPAAGFGLTTASGGVNLFMGNNPEADGLNNPPSFVHGGPGHQYQDFASEAERLSGRKLTAGEMDRYWRGRALQWFHARPARAWGLVLRKAGCFWNHKEPPDNFFLTIFRKFTSLNGLPLPGWGWIAPLGLLGMLLGLSDWRRNWPLQLYVLAYVAVNALFFVLSRYRFPAAAALIPFAGLSLCRLHDSVQARAWRRLALVLAWAAPCVLLCRLPLIGEEDAAVTHYSMAVIYANQGWKDQAVEQYRLSLQADPRFSASYLNLGLLLAERGQREEAAAALDSAAGLEQDPARAEKMRLMSAGLKGNHPSR